MGVSHHTQFCNPGIESRASGGRGLYQHSHIPNWLVLRQTLRLSRWLGAPAVAHTGINFLILGLQVCTTYTP